MSKHTLGLVVGSFLGLLHIVWSFAVAVMPGAVESFMNWVLELHHIDIGFYIIQPFSLANAAILVIFTFAWGYVIGYVLAALFNKLHK